jgi:hypothetical protein
MLQQMLRGHGFRTRPKEEMPRANDERDEAQGQDANLRAARAQVRANKIAPCAVHKRMEEKKPKASKA